AIQSAFQYAEGKINDTDGFYRDGYTDGLRMIQTEIDEMEETYDVIPQLIVNCRDFFDAWDDAKEAKEDENDVSYLQGKFEAVQFFMDNFNYWLKGQDFDTIVKHSVNEYIHRLHDATKEIDVKERFLQALTMYKLDMYDVGTDGKIVAVRVKTEGKEQEVMTVDEFTRSFKFDHLEADFPADCK
ncbi:hypothetical protein, partial [Bacillus mycoides]|uniref:hypothetical protein n=1 Tax=Bacillus mycoides TaxID=1405 RepID=UPI003A7FC33E